MKLTGNIKAKLNLSIDILMFILLLGMAGIGFLMKYVVVSGEVRNVIYGNQTDLEFMGMTRHQWGSIHLLLSIVFISILVLHIILHWKLIVCIYNSMFSSNFIRYGLAGLLCILTLAAFISPFILEPEKVPFKPKNRNRNQSISLQKTRQPETEEIEASLVSGKHGSLLTDSFPSEKEVPAGKIHEEKHSTEYSGFEVYGYHTLRYVAERYNVPPRVITGALNIPENHAGERLSWLRKQYGFTMNDVKKIIFDYKKNNK
jgi:hypothetical protein